MNKYNQEFGGWEQVKKFELLPEEWSVETGELTPTLKLKRKIIMSKCESLVNKIYEKNWLQDSYKIMFLTKWITFPLKD